MEQETRELRRAHALQELQLRGVLKSDKLPALSRLLFKLRPQTKPIYYGDHWLYGTVMGIGFAIPFVLMIGGAFYMEEDIPTWPGVLIGVGAGVMFGGVMTFWMRTVQRKAKLTAWEDLDAPPAEDAEAAAAYAELEGDFTSRAGRTVLRTTAPRD